MFKKKKNNTFIQNEPIKLIKSVNKDIYNVTQDFHLNAVLLIFLINKRNSFHKNIEKNNCFQHWGW